MALSAATDAAEAVSPPASMRALYLAQAPALRQALSRLAGPGVDADDLLQDVFVVALRRPDALATARSPQAWLYGVAAKVAASRRRTARWKRWLGMEALEDAPSGDSPQLALEQRQAARAVAKALERLSATRREALVLFELQGLSGAEVAEALGVPLKTVWTRLFYARRDFAAAIAEDERHG